MPGYQIRVIGDPVLKQRAGEVSDIDGKVARLVDDMFEVMYAAPGIGLAAPQVGVQKRLFVFDDHEQKGVLVNPEIVEADGEWVFNEGCLSIPGLYFEIARPERILIRGRDLDGNEVEREVGELEARLFQHELDHLDGLLMTEHLTEAQAKASKRAVRQLMLGERPADDQLVLDRDGQPLDER